MIRRAAVVLAAVVGLTAAGSGAAANAGTSDLFAGAHAEMICKIKKYVNGDRHMRCWSL